MALIEHEYNAYLDKYVNVWVADDKSELVADFDSESAPSSMIFVISTQETYMKNTAGKWQKMGSSEVVA